MIGKVQFKPFRQQHNEELYAVACQEGDLERLIALLDPEGVWHGDGGGKVLSWVHHDKQHDLASAIQDSIRTYILGAKNPTREGTRDEDL